MTNNTNDRPARAELINVVAIKRNATAVSFQADSWADAVTRVLAMADEDAALKAQGRPVWYDLEGDVYMRNVRDEHSHVEHHELVQLRRDRELGRV